MHIMLCFKCSPCAQFYFPVCESGVGSSRQLTVCLAHPNPLWRSTAVSFIGVPEWLDPGDCYSLSFCDSFCSADMKWNFYFRKCSSLWRLWFYSYVGLCFRKYPTNSCSWTKNFNYNCFLCQQKIKLFNFCCSQLL